MGIKRYNIQTAIIATIVLAVFSCKAPDPDKPGAVSGLVEVTAELYKNTRTLLNGNDFDDGDRFDLYYGSPYAGNPHRSAYVHTASPKSWKGAPGLYWDDLDIWGAPNGNGAIVSETEKFTAVLTNGGMLSLGENVGDPATFTVSENQQVADDADFLKNDLLVAYGGADVTNASNRLLSLKFNHVFAQLKITLEEEAAGDDHPILSEGVTLTIKGAKNESTITFDNLIGTDPELFSTAVAASGEVKPGGIVMRKTEGIYEYSVILPAQTFAPGSDAKILISRTANDREYEYALNSGKLTSAGGVLQQGKRVILELKISKTGVGFEKLNIEDWGTKRAEGSATPDGYPEIIIGEGDDGGGAVNPGEEDGYVGKILKLSSDVYASDNTGIEGRGEWLKIPIGTQKAPFRGTFDGEGYTITVVLDGTVSDPFFGIFGYTEGATIRNLNVIGVTIENNNTSNSTATGGLAGYVNNTRIENCHVQFDKVSARNDNAGGFVGYVNGATRILNSSARVRSVEAGHDYAGGFIGRCEEVALISESFATANVTAAGYYAGGFTGASQVGTFEFCYAWGDIEANRFIGGFAGMSEGTFINNSYASGMVTGNVNPGGLIGNSKEAVPRYCYWNSATAGGRGTTGDVPDDTNYGFSLVKTEAAMGTVLNGLNRDREGGEQLEVWKLEKRASDNYILPVLKNNSGSVK